MAEKLDPRQVVTFEELLRAMIFETEATRRVLVNSNPAGITFEAAWGGNVTSGPLRYPSGLHFQRSAHTSFGRLLFFNGKPQIGHSKCNRWSV